MTSQPPFPGFKFKWVLATAHGQTLYSTTMTSNLPPLIQACSGSIGSAAANAASYPLDLVTTRLQTSRSKRIRGLQGAVYLLRQIIRRHGPTALYDGLNTDTGATVLSVFFYYYFYSFLRSLLIHRRGLSASSKSKTPPLNAVEELALGWIAGLGSRLISTPLSVVTIRMQTEREDAEEDEANGNVGSGEGAGVGAVIGRIYDDNGLLGFWQGFSSAIPLAFTPSLTMFIYQVLRRGFLPAKFRDQPTPGQAFIGGAISQSVAVTLLYPLMLAKTRIQTARSSSSTGTPSVTTPATKNQNILGVWQTAYEREGVKGIYQGLEAQVVKGIISQGVTLMVKTRIEQLVVAAYLRRAATRRV